MSVYVITDGERFIDWDDHGAMSTGEPIWTTLEKARQYQTKDVAMRRAVSVKRSEKCGVAVIAVNLTLAESFEVILPEDDPEWSEYQRLQAKFRNK